MSSGEYLKKGHSELAWLGSLLDCRRLTVASAMLINIYDMRNSPPLMEYCN